MAIRKAIEAHAVEHPGVTLSSNLQLSDESKRVLASAAEEADRLSHQQIDAEQLLLGLLQLPNCFAAQLLRDQGLSPELLREHFAALGMNAPAPVKLYPYQKRFGNRATDQALKIHGAAWNADFIRDRVKTCRKFNWQKQQWRSRDIVVHRETGGISFDVTLVSNSREHDLVKGGWKKDYCVICCWELWEASDDPLHGVGYSNGREWMCTECYDRFISNRDFFSTNDPEIT